MKKINFRHFPRRFAMLGAVALLAAAALIPATAFAATTTQTKCAADDVKCVIGVGDTLIANRLTSLTTLNGKISSDESSHKITSDQASSLQGDVSSNQAGMNTVKTKLDAETTAKAARQDVLSIFTQYRIYAVVLPRDYRQLEMDIEVNAKDIMQGVAPTIQTALGSAPTGDQTRLNALFSDYQKQVQAAETQLATAQNDFPAMTVANFNQNHTAFESNRLALDSALKAARGDLHQAAKDLKEMANTLGIKK